MLRAFVSVTLASAFRTVAYWEVVCVRKTSIATTKTLARLIVAISAHAKDQTQANAGARTAKKEIEYEVME